MLEGTVKHTKLVIMIIIVFFFIYSGANKLIAFPGWPEQFEVWGLGRIGMYIVGVTEFIIASLIFIKDTRYIGLISLIIFMTGALYIHISNFEYDEIYPAIYFILGACLVMGLDMLEKRLGKQKQA